MRDVTKSMLSYTWAMSVFSIQQAANLFSRGAGPGQCNRATEVFDEITGAVTGELDGRLKTVFRVGDNLQRRFVDVMSAGLGALDPSQFTRSRAAAGATSGGGPGGNCGCSGTATAGGEMPPGWTFGRAPSGAPVPQDSQSASTSADGPSAARQGGRPMPPR